jgi:hypothetical protein
MERGIEEFRKLFEQHNTAILRDATRRVSNAIVRESPIAVEDGGYYVADWDVQVGSFPAEDGTPLPDPKKRKTRAALNQIIDTAEYGQSLFFQNDDEVAVRLEFGYSKQAPQGVVRKTARRWRSFVKGAGRAAQSRIRKMLITSEN